MTNGSGFLRAPEAKLMVEHLEDLRLKAAEAMESANGAKSWALRALMLLLLLSLNMDASGQTQVDFQSVVHSLNRNEDDAAGVLDVILRSVDIWEPIAARYPDSLSQMTSIIAEGVSVAVKESRPIEELALRTSLEYDVVHDAGEIANDLTA